MRLFNNFALTVAPLAITILLAGCSGGGGNTTNNSGSSTSSSSSSSSSSSNSSGSSSPLAVDELGAEHLPTNELLGAEDMPPSDTSELSSGERP